MMEHRASIAKHIVVLAVVIGLFGLSQPLSAQQTVLHVGMQDWGDTYGRQIFHERIIPAFEAAHPGVKVEITWTSWNTYGSQYAVWYAGGVMPDVVSIGSSGLGQFASQGMLQPIDKYVADWDGFDDMPPPAIQDGMMDGQLYSIGYLLDVRPLLYNKRMFSESGLPAEAPETWDDILQYAQRLVRRDASGTMTQEGIDIRSDVQHALPWIFQNGGAFFSDDGRVALNEDPVVETLQFLQDMIHVHRVALPGGVSFVRGESAMIYDAAWYMVPELNPSLDDMGVTIPRQVNQTTQVHINKFAISSTSENPDLAWEWIAHVMEPEHLALIASNSPRLTARISTMEYAPYNLDPRWQTWMNAAVLSTALPGHVPEFGQLMNELNKAVGDILREPTPVRTRLDELVRTIENSVLN